MSHTQANPWACAENVPQASAAQAQQQRQPLSAEHIERLTGCKKSDPLWLVIFTAVRSTEEAHGISTTPSI